MTTARLGLLCLPRSVASAVADARLAEEVGFSMVGVADSQSVFREMYATMALCAQTTRRVRIGPSVTNAITRHPAVASAAVSTKTARGTSRSVGTNTVEPAGNAASSSFPKRVSSGGVAARMASMTR